MVVMKMATVTMEVMMEKTMINVTTVPDACVRVGS